MSGYRAVPPAPPLRPFVESLWVNAVPAGHRDGRILPDGRIDLVWIRGHGVLVAGPQSRFTNRPVEAPLVALGARFRPGAAASLLRVPATELLDGHVPLAAVEPRLAARLDALLEGARDDREALVALGRELTRRLADLAQPDPALRAAVSLLRHSSMSVAAVAERVFLSERQLHRRFTETVGYGPKTLQRILRFQRALAELRTPRMELAGAAAAAGYADQAHLSRESRRLAGLSPGELARWVG